MRASYPVLLDLTQRLVVIIGGGSVAVRKARGLIEAGATQVRCVAPEFHPDLPAQVQRVAESFAPQHLDGAALVFAATNSPEVNQRVVEEARRRGIFVNRADTDNEHPGDFATPAIWRGEAVLIGVSAGGSPTLAAKIRDDLGTKVDPLHLKMAQTMQALRPMIRDAAGLDEATRRGIFRDLVTPAAMQALASGGTRGLLDWIRRKYPAASGL